jgi:hypothetical protein
MDEMTSFENERTQIRYARLAGFMYLFIMAAYLLRAFIASRFEVPGNLVETAHRIKGAELVYRIGLSLGILETLCAVLLAMGLYVVVKPINNNLALLALIFELVYVAVGGVFSMIGFVFLKLRMGPDSAGALDERQLSIFADLHSSASSVGVNGCCIIYGAGSILFFYLFLKSNYIPRFLAALGLLASVLVPITGFVFLIFPQPSQMLLLGWVPIFAAELSVGLWLLVKGVNLKPREAE